MDKKIKSDQSLIDKYNSEYTKWFNVLNKYHTNRFDKNYKQYTTLASVVSTKSKISDPVVPDIVEKVVQKLFEREPKFYVLGRGFDVPKEITDIITATASYFWNNPEAINTSGPKKPKLKMAGREFCVIGNTAVEVYFDSEADNPDFRVIPIEDIIFDPTQTLKTSKVHYIRQYVSLEELKEREDFKNLDKIEGWLEKEETEENIQNDPSKNKITRSGSSLYQDQTKNLELISRYEGSKVCRIVNWQWIIQEDDDVLGIEESPLNFAMDIELLKQPYALGLIDDIMLPAKAKDLILNQTIDWGAKALNPPLFVDPNITTSDKSTLSNAWRLGGVVMANPQMAQHQTMPNLPPVSFELMNYLQTRMESAAGTTNVYNQDLANVKKTATGINQMVEQGSTPISDRQQNLEESLIEPMVNKWLKMAGKMMGKDETKFVFMSGTSPKWVKITKGLLTGKITLNDLMTAQILEIEQINEIAQDMLSNGLNPEKELAFDVDWIVRVETGSMAQQDTEKEIQSFDSWVQQALAMGKQLDIDKILTERGLKAGIKEPDQYYSEIPQGMGQGQPTQPQTPTSPMMAATLLKK